jgi:hypothetical protein
MDDESWRLKAGTAEDAISDENRRLVDGTAGRLTADEGWRIGRWHHRRFSIRRELES